LAVRLSPPRKKDWFPVAPEIEQRFVDIMRSWIVTLPHDLKILNEAADDENLPRELRELAVGALIYAISPTDFVATDGEDFAGYADDCIMLRLALQQVNSKDDEDCQFFVSRFKDFFDKLPKQLEDCSAAMGELFTWLEGKTKSLRTLEYKGKKIPRYLDEEEDRELLYEDGLGFATEYPVVERELADRFKKASSVIEVLQKSLDQELLKQTT